MNDLIDIGANLTHDSFDADRSAVMQRAQDAGVRRMIVTGTTVDATRDAINLAGEHVGVLFATAGVHPHHAAEVDAAAIETLSKLAGEPSVVAIGECGLDFFRNYSPREAQLIAFEAQLSIAVDTGKPLFLHQRDAHDPFIDLLRKYLPQIPAGGVAHCFTGTRNEMQEYLDLGLHIGITGWICDERRGDSLREAARYLPLDRVLLETDAPYLLPRDLPEKPSGRRNEPGVLPHVLKVLAQHMGQDATRIAQATTENAARLFRLTQ